MRLLEMNPELSQREIARELGISLGKVNYCLQALIKKGWIRAANVATSRSRATYHYLLTPRGIQEKANLTLHFLQTKQREYELLGAEIREIQKEANCGERVGSARDHAASTAPRKLRNEPL